MASSTDVMFWIYVIGLLMAFVMGPYATYWAFNIRKALRVKAYSRQALIIGLFSIYGTILYFAFYIVYFLDPALFNSPVGDVQRILYLVFAPIIFGWIDVSIRVGRRTDPLLRDPLRWSRLRLVLWPVLLLTLIGFFLPGATGLLSFAVIGIAVIPVYMAAKWSGDLNYRLSLEWFALAIALVVIQNIGYNTLLQGFGTGIVYSPPGFVWTVVANFALLPVVFYSVYRCVRSLVPLNRMVPETDQPASGGPAPALALAMRTGS
jgi:hypothetical protein